MVLFLNRKKVTAIEKNKMRMTIGIMIFLFLIIFVNLQFRTTLRISEVLHFGFYVQNLNILLFLLISLYSKLQQNRKVRDLGEKNLHTLNI